MKLSITVELDTKQERAFLKRVETDSTPEALAASIVTANAQMWADADYQALSGELVTALHDEPQEVLDKVTEQILHIVKE